MTQLPTAFVADMNTLLGAEESGRLCTALAEESPTSLRLNPQKAATPYDGMVSVPWCEGGYYLPQRPSFTRHPLLHAGCFYVQEAASMFVARAYAAMDFTPHRVLDLCAAPGGKSTLWRSLLPEGALLVANEPMRQRANILAENLTKWGQADVVVTNGYAEDFARLQGFFDVIATDVPCSGEGMFRKDEGAIAEWSPDAAERCALRGWDIVSQAWPALREGGYLVYSTCTFNRTEDEDQVRRICRELGAEAVEIPVPAEWGITGDVTGSGLPVYRFLPHRTRGEGFFLALLRKTAPCPATRTPKKDRRPVRTGAVRDAAAVSKWLRRSSDFKIFAAGDEGLAAVRQSLYEDIVRLSGAVRTLQAGIPLAVRKGAKLIPHHALALSVECAPEAFPRCELPLETALHYLAREAVTLPPETPRGYVIVTFGGHALGFVNNLGPRANNMYPTEWRIRHAAAPENHLKPCNT